MSQAESQFASLAAAQSFSAQQGLRDWDEVRRCWNELSGESISRARVWQIGKRAEAKLRAALVDVAAEYFQEE